MVHAKPRLLCVRYRRAPRAAGGGVEKDPHADSSRSLSISRLKDKPFTVSGMACRFHDGLFLERRGFDNSTHDLKYTGFPYVHKITDVIERIANKTVSS